MWIIVTLGVIGLIIFIVNNDHNDHVKTHVSNQGGMITKYHTVVDYLKSSGMSVHKVTKDGIVIGSKSMTWTLDYVGYNLEIRMQGFMPLLGSVNKKWAFPDGYPQEKIIEEIENYLTWQISQLKKITENEPYSHINR